MQKNTNLLFNQWKTGDGLKTAMPTPRKPKPKLLTAHGIMPERFQTSEHWREWQANHFAACILIPRFSLLREFEERFGTIQLAHPISKKKEAYAKEVARMNRPDNFGDTRSLSELYCVSNTAMAIRLTDLELIV